MVATSFTDCFQANRFGERLALFSEEASGDYPARAATRWANVWYRPIIPDRMISIGDRPPKCASGELTDEVRRARRFFGGGGRTASEHLEPARRI